ncbi:hypothetical protein [Conexibacter sp. S30A1]|uniref:hypothetical protein n=1 Tax=Conexibacter sp. S30A1 TaxID=2937800 RepID=UPI00200C271A|nr:hypothetical protein [Conexibacter sp. S30A1]
MPAVPEGERSLPRPPDAAAWASAPLLETIPGAALPGLISDGGGLPFEPARLTRAAAALDPQDAAVTALLVQIDRGRQLAQPARLLRPRAKPTPLPPEVMLDGWRELARDDEQALFGRGAPPHLLTVAVRRARGGRWEPLGASNSRPLRAVRDGIRASSWRLDRTIRLDPDSPVLHILVTERTMASGTPVAERLLAPELYIDTEVLLLRVYVRPLAGYVGRAGRHETPVRVALPEPLGGRTVLDGALFEPGAR